MANPPVKGKKPRAKRNVPKRAVSIAAPAARTVVQIQRGPTFQSRESGVLLSNCEPLWLLEEGVDSLVTNMVLMAGSRNLTWLPTVAKAYSKYRWRALRPYYVPLCSTGVGGEVALAINYDRSGDAAASTMNHVLTQSFAVSGAPHANNPSSDLSNLQSRIPPGSLAIDVDVQRFQNPWYPFISSNAFDSKGAMATPDYVPCNLLIAHTADKKGVLGRVWLSYVIELIEPTTPELNS